MADVVEGTNAIVAPVVMDDEALKATDVSNLERLQGIKSRLENKKPPSTDGPKPRGRPPGSKNKTPEERAATVRDTRTASQRMLAGRTQPPKGKDGEPTTQEKIAAKHDRVEELADKISDGFNNNIAMVLISMGMPSEAIYKPGREPKRVADSSPYTEFVGQILISPGQAEIWAKFLAELEQTELAKKMVGTGDGNSNAAMLLYGAASILAALQYVQGVNNFYKQMKPLLDHIKAQKLEQEAQQQARERANAGA